MNTKPALQDARWSTFEGAVGVLLALAITCCGGPWGIGDAVLAASAMLLIAWTFARQGRNGLPRWGWTEWALVLLMMALALSQSLPVPMAVWERLPGRMPMARDLAVAGVTPAWMTLGLDRLGAFRGLAALLPALAVFVALRSLPDAALVRLLGVAVALGVVSVLLGLLQIAGGGDAWWRMHDFHNRTGTLGFFANRNHQSAFLVMLLPVAVALLQTDRATGMTRLWRALVLPALSLLILGIALTYSRAGIALGALALVACILLVRRQLGGSARKPWAMLTVASIGVALVLQFALFGLIQRFGQDAFHDSRWSIFAATVHSGRDYQPLGAGLGAYAQAVQATGPNRNLVGAWLNHAHNDWLELWLELGATGVLALLLLAGICVLAARRAWRAEGALAHLARAASISIVLVALHSLVDWPLRTGSNMVLLALLVATLLRGGASAASGQQSRRFPGDTDGS